MVSAPVSQVLAVPFEIAATWFYVRGIIRFLSSLGTWEPIRLPCDLLQEILIIKLFPTGLPAKPRLVPFAWVQALEISQKLCHDLA